MELAWFAIAVLFSAGVGLIAWWARDVARAKRTNR